MPDLMQRGLRWYADKLNQSASQPIVYKRGVDQCDLYATIGRTQFEADDGSGTIDSYESRDFLIRPKDLVIAGAEVLPERGDQVIEGELTYTVDMPPNMQVWQHEGFRQWMRIHTWKRNEP